MLVASVHFFRGPWFRDDGSLMILIRESENNSELFLSPRPRRNNELRRLHYTAQSDVATVSSNILRLIEAEERNMSPAQLHQLQPAMHSTLTSSLLMNWPTVGVGILSPMELGTISGSTKASPGLLIFKR